MKTDIKPDAPLEFDTTSLDSLPGIIWKLLEEGARKTSSPFHTPALASVGENGVDVRTVVLRHADSEARQIFCHTDWRSPKRIQVERDPRICWHFYDRVRKIQLRVRGRAVLQRKSELATKRWETSPPSSRMCYASSLPPGHLIARPMATPTDPEAGQPNFTVLICRAETMDWLFLHAAGHRRALLNWQQETWKSNWVSP